MKNTDIENFLKQYIDANNHPGYGILISGEWGVGKTHFLKKIIESVNEPKKVIYVSLYGMSNTSQIDDDFFKLLHPILGSKISKFAGRMAKLAVKATLKIDLDNDNKEDATLDLQIPSINLSSLVEMNKNVVIVIDDLERSNIDYPILLGYINHLVEHEELKVIIAGHEPVVQSKFEQYRIIKEKTIGKTFNISADYNSAIETFLSSVSTFTVRNILKPRKIMILDVFLSSGFSNLRFLRQFFIEFEFVILKLKNKINSNEFVDAFLKQYLIFCIEHKSGFLQYEDFNDMDSNPYTLEEKETKIAHIRDKYKHLEEFKYILNAVSWRDIVIHGCMDEAHINQQVSESSFFISNERKMPIWRMLWESRLLNDEDFDYAIAQALLSLENCTITQIGEILHISASFIQFIDNDVIDMKFETLEILAKNAIEHAIKQATYSFDTNSHSCGNEFAMTWNGHYYTNYENSKVTSLVSFATETLERKVSFEREDIAINLFSRIDGTPDNFIKEIYSNPNSTTSFNEISFLNYIPPKEFMNKLINLQPKTRSRLAAALSRRYSSGSAYRKLTAEIEWLIQLNKIAQETIKTLKGAKKLFMIEFINNTLSNAIYQLKQAQEEIKTTH
ncbi:TPA: P-loop NTPase fold protein [Citrobacter koseri]